MVVALVAAGILYFPELKNSVAATTGTVEMVTVQNYVGQDYDAISQENATGIKFEKVNILSEQPKGQILSQEPAANTEVEKGSTITFQVSTGVETVQVPDVSKKHYQVAMDELFDLGILYKTTFVSHDTIKENYVVKTDPAAFTEIQSDSTITIYISSGPDIVTVEVPNLVKRNVDDAVEKLAALNLKADKLYEYDEDVPADCVISQDKEAGTLVEEGTSIEITISLGPKHEETPEDEKNPEDEGSPEDEETSEEDKTSEDEKTPEDDKTSEEDKTSEDEKTPEDDKTSEDDKNSDKESTSDKGNDKTESETRMMTPFNLSL